MNRRDVLTRGGVLLSAGALAGCLDRYRSLDRDERPTTRSEPTRTDRSFAVLDSGCGTRTNTASVAFGGDYVTVTGTITGRDACRTAELASATYDASSGTLVVTVATVAQRDADLCAQCLTGIQYEATVSFEGDLPEAVTVVHRSLGEARTVARRTA